MIKNNKFWLLISGLSGFSGVALGAFGAHILESSLSPQMIETYNTGILYHLIHSVVLLAIALSWKEKYYISAIFFLSGIILFSFSLYLFSFTELTFLVILTPFGGLSFLIGWGVIAWQAIKNIKRDVNHTI